MATPYPNIIERSDAKECVVIPCDEFLLIREELENSEDLKELRKANRKESGITGLPLSAVRKKPRTCVQR